MRIWLEKDPTQVCSFAQLFTHTLSIIPPSAYGNLTVVLGPVTAETEMERARNLSVLVRHEHRLAENGWAVLCLSTYQDTYQRLLRECGIARYPREILEEFLFPFFDSGYLTVAHMRQNYDESRGASMEHHKLQESGIPITYLP